MWWILLIIIWVIIINQLFWSNKKIKQPDNNEYQVPKTTISVNKGYEVPKKTNPYNNNYQFVKRTTTPYLTNLSELYKEYKEHSFVPPLDSLVRWAYEKWKITSWKFDFNGLNEEDKKTILRIAINIWNKRRKEKA